jgi:3-oxoacyl-[acyl-carrier-protein] synthase III
VSDAILTATAPERAALARQPRGAAVGSAALAVPATVVPNAPIAERLGVDERWIESRTGVLERRVLQDGERLSDLAAEAGAYALERAAIDPEDVDLVLVATTSQDEVTPNTAPLAARRIGAVNAAAIDVGAACTAFISALPLAAAQIESGRADAALVIGADALTRFVDPDDRRTAALFGDGAGAVVMTPAAEGRVGPVVLRSDGDKLDMIHARRGEKLFMQGHETFVHATARMAEVTLQTLERAGLGLEEVDLFVYHQANGRILRAVGERLGLPPERVVDCIARYANTSAASIPIALAEMEEQGRLREGARVLLGAFGAGFTWGGALIEWGRDGG